MLGWLREGTCPGLSNDNSFRFAQIVYSLGKRGAEALEFILVVFWFVLNILQVSVTRGRHTDKHIEFV